MDKFKDKQITLCVVVLLLIATAAFFCFAMLFTAAGYNTFSYSKTANTAVLPTETPTIIIDAGHGGEDPGAVYDDITEKDINLSVSLYLGELFKSNGYNVVLTRTEDKLLYGEGEENHKKRYDLKNRLDIAKSEENAILLSIHVNKFSSSKYSGLQVFYSVNNTDSKVLATHIQNTIRHLQPDNNRVCKDQKGSIYLLDKFDGVGVLIECGFISNDLERALLCNNDYQKKLALTIYSAVCEYLNGENK